MRARTYRGWAIAVRYRQYCRYHWEIDTRTVSRTRREAIARYDGEYATPAGYRKERDAGFVKSVRVVVEEPNRITYERLEEIIASAAPDHLAAVLHHELNAEAEP